MLGRWDWFFEYIQGTWKDEFILYKRTAEGHIVARFERDNTDPAERWEHRVTYA